MPSDETRENFPQFDIQLLLNLSNFDGDMNIRKKIMLGFLCLGAMLAFSGMISTFQLRRLSRNTENLLNSSIKSIAVSKAMLDVSQEQNTSLLHMIVLGQTEFDSTFTASRIAFGKALKNAASMAESNAKGLDSIYTARDNYYELIDSFFHTPGEKDIEWFMQMYGSSYMALTSAIKNYMVASQHITLSKAESLERYAYRAIIPGIITLCVAILLIIVFAFMMETYYIRPVERMTKGLDSLLKHRFPYNVEVEGNDEIARLNDQLEELAALARDRIKE